MKYTEDIQIVSVNMIFISPCQVRKVFCKSGKVLNEIYIISLHDVIPITMIIHPSINGHNTNY